RSGSATSNAPTTAASAPRRTAGDRPAHIIRSRAAHSNAPPTAPPGQDTAETGRCGPCSATQTIHSAGRPPRQATACEPPAQSGDSTAANTPSTVAAGTAGAASRFAGMATRLTNPPTAAITGAVTRLAAAVTANASARPAGSPRLRNPTAQPGARTIRPAVASPDSAKPGDRASSGCQSSKPMTAAPRLGRTARGRPQARATSASTPMAAARSTLGEGRANTTKPTVASPPAAADSRGPAPSRRATKRTAPTTYTRLAPETATRCDSPAVRKSATSTGSIAEVSPTARPGSRPAAPVGRPEAAACSPARSRPATRWPQDGGATASGGPRDATTAVVRSPPSDGPSRP